MHRLSLKALVMLRSINEVTCTEDIKVDSNQKVFKLDMLEITDEHQENIPELK